MLFFFFLLLHSFEEPLQDFGVSVPPFSEEMTGGQKAQPLESFAHYWEGPEHGVPGGAGPCGPGMGSSGWVGKGTCLFERVA